MGTHSGLINDQYWKSMAGEDEVDHGPHERKNRDFAINDPLGFEDVGGGHHVYRPETLNDLITVLVRIRDEEFDGNGDVRVSSINRIRGIEAVRSAMAVDWGVDPMGEDADGEVLIASSSYLPLEHEKDDGSVIALQQDRPELWSEKDVERIVDAMKIVHMTDPGNGNATEYKRLKADEPDVLRLAKIADGLISYESDSGFDQLTDDDLSKAAEQALRISNE